MYNVRFKNTDGQTGKCPQQEKSDIIYVIPLCGWCLKDYKKSKSTNVTGQKTFKLREGEGKDGKQSKNKDIVEKGMQHKSKETVAVVFGWELVCFMVIF